MGKLSSGKAQFWKSPIPEMPLSLSWFLQISPHSLISSHGSYSNDQVTAALPEALVDENEEGGSGINIDDWSLIDHL